MNVTQFPGFNRTGLKASPVHGKALIEGAEGTVPSTEGESGDALSVRAAYAKDADPVATVPPPGSAKELLTDLKAGLAGQKAPVFLDKLGERLAFERSGTRLYEGLLLKLETHGSWPGGPERAELEKIHADEHRHFLMLSEHIAGLGADPTAVTPSANLHGVASEGLCKVISDPRTNLQECLEAILVAELVDNDCWVNLTELARAGGHDEMVRDFEGAIEDERLHLEMVRAWLAAALGTRASFGSAKKVEVVRRLSTAERAPRKRVTASAKKTKRAMTRASGRGKAKATAKAKPKPSGKRTAQRTASARSSRLSPKRGGAKKRKATPRTKP